MSPPRRVIAFSRRGLVLLGAVEEEGDPLRVVAEGGGQLQIPPAAVLRRFLEELPGGTPKEIGRALRGLRLDDEERADLELIWESLPDREGPFAFDDLVAAWSGEATDEGALAVIRSLNDGLPWFEPGPDGMIRNDRETVDREIVRRENERRARELEAELITWVQEGARGKVPGADEGKAILAEMERFALRGPEGAAKRAVRIARKAGCPEADDLLERLEEGGVVDRDLDPGPARWGVRVRFPEGLADSLAPVGDAEREDLTGHFTVALDDPETVEVDDALSWEETGDGLLLSVHIADVAARIAPGSPLDEEAARRSRTVYEPDRRIPMLPPEVVPQVSLEEGEVRPAVTGTFHVTHDGEVLSSRFARTWVRVDRRAGYDAAGAELLGPTVAIARALRVRRVDEGAVCLDLPDLKLVVEDGRPIVKIRRPETDGDHVIAEAAVLYNRAVADVLAEAGATAIFRSQGPLDEELPPPDDPLRVIRSRRALPPADASTEPSRHHGVAADRYVMATSPIRRYVDLIHQRQLVAVMAGETPPHDLGEVEAALEEMRDRDRAARNVETDRFGYWLGRYLEARTGEVLHGLVSRTMAAGRIGVWVDEILRELTLRLPKGHDPVREGDPIAVRIVKVRPRRGSVHLEVAEEG
jgi:exoribonuclease-2